MTLPADSPIPQAALTEPPALVCTLTDGDRQAQALEWADLGALSLTSERIEGGVASTYPLALEAQLRDLTDRENNCCGSWLTGTVQRTGNIVRLEITTSNPDGLALIESMAGVAP